MNGLKTVGGCFNVDLSVVFDDFEPFTINWWQIDSHLFICISKQGRKGKKTDNIYVCFIKKKEHPWPR